jgi:NADH-quinone oxidoreductase subunit G
LNDHLIDRGVLSSDDLDSKFLVMFASNESKTTQNADLLFPITCIAEHAASYINVDGRIQRSFPAKETKYTNRRLTLEMSEGRLDRYGTSFDNWVSDENKIDCLPVWDLMSLLGDKLGLELSYENGAREILSEISNTLPAFGDVSYEKMDDESGIQLDTENIKVKS